MERIGSWEIGRITGRLRRFVKHLHLAGLLGALLEADRRYRQARKLDRLEYPHIRDMGIDLGRVRRRDNQL